MITSAKNPRIVLARKLHQRKHRLRQNRFLIDGLQLLAMALQNNRVQPQEIFYCPSLFTGEIAPRLLDQLTQVGGEDIAVAPNVLATLSERDTPQGIIASFTLNSVETPLPDMSDLIQSCSAHSSLIIVLDRLQDPGNLGTLIRTADAVAATAIILLEPCVDPFDPKTVRGTMGSLFNVPFFRVPTPVTILPFLREQRYQIVGADGRLGQIAWQNEGMANKTVLVLGNEARGLSDDLHPFLTNYVRLPLLGQAESLNVAIAGGILMYEWIRQTTT